MSTSELQPDESGALPVETSTPKGRRSLARVKRELSEEELSTPGVQKMLIEELERLDTEARELEQYRDKYYIAEREVAVLNEKFRKNVAVEIIANGSLTIGAAAIGYAPAVWTSQPTGWIAIVFGAVLIIAGVVARVVRQ